MYKDEIDFEKERHVACLINARCSRRFTYVSISAFSSCCMIQVSLRMAGKCCWLLLCMFNYFLFGMCSFCSQLYITKHKDYVQVHFDHVREYNGIA